MTEPPNRSWAHRLRDWWIDQIIRHHRLVLGLGLVLTLVSAWLASRLEIDSDMRALLPADHEVVEAIEHIEANYGAVGSINVLIQGGAAPARHALADAIAKELEDEPMLREVDHRLASNFFIEHALYYLEEPEMDTLVDRVEAWQHYQFCSAAPDVCIEPPDPRAPEALQSFIDAKREAVEQRAGFRDYYEREGIDAQVMFLRPTQSSANLDYAVEVSDRMLERVSAVYARAGPWHAAGVHFNMVGPYVNKAAERKIIGRDMVRSGAVALLGVTAVLYLLFRSWRAIGTLLLPLICGVTWSLGATQLAIGHLNAITSLISSVVMGIGIDAGIHILARARREREDHDSEQTIRRAFKAVIAPLLIASCTTASAFVVMASSEFPAFGEFGIIAGFGVALCLLAMLTMYPALLTLVGIKPAKRMPPDGIGGATRVLLARPGLIFAAIVLLTLASFRGIDHMRDDGFERSTRPLQSDQTREATEADVFLISEIFGRNVHASVLSVPTYAELERVYERASKQHARRVAADDTRVAELVAAPSVMPPKHIDQLGRRARITSLTEDWSPRIWAQLRGEDPEDLDDGSDEWDDFEPLDRNETDGEAEGDPDEETDPSPAPAPAPAPAPTPTPGGIDPKDGATLQRMLEAQPFGPEDLPPEAIGKLRGDDGSWGLFAYPNYDAADILTSVEFMDEVQAYADGAGTFAGEPTVYATIYTTLKDEWPVVIGMAISMIAAFVFWQVRSLGQTLVTIAPLALAFWWTFGILGAFDLKLTLFSVPILPAILGIGVDNGVYLTAAIRREQRTNTGLHRSVDETGRAILAATMTTAMGFGAFLVADNGGLRTIGQLAVVGIMSTAVASLLAVPTIAALVQRRRDRHF